LTPQLGLFSWTNFLSATRSPPEHLNSVSWGVKI
jgi:hypothetical protein